MNKTVFLSHDVDYGVTGPPKAHIIERKDRFDKDAFNEWLLHGKPLYSNISEMMDIEYDLGVRSTFFFRPWYEEGNLLEHAWLLPLLIKDGWEVGLHINNTDNIKYEKQELEQYTRNKITGTRVHMLKSNPNMYEELNKEGIKYDSTLSYSKCGIVHATPLKVKGVTIFPVTIMDAYLFTYMKIKEDNILGLFKQILGTVIDERHVLTIDWHDCALKMKGGRMYKKILELLVSENCDIMTGEKICQRLG